MTDIASTPQTPMPLARRIDRPLVAFWVLAYAIAWGTLALLGVIARQSGVDGALALLTMGEAYDFAVVTLSVPPWLVYLLTRLADFAFSIAGVVMIVLTAGRSGLRELWQRLTRWHIAPKWYVVGLLPILLYVLAVVVAGTGEAVALSGDTLLALFFSAEAGLLVSLFLRGAMGEELGLRGFVLPRLQERMSPARASLIIGLFWGAWHLPVLLGRDPVSIIAFIVLSFGLSFVFTWMFNGSGGSLIPGLLFHATQNWEEGFETLFPALVGTDWELVSTLALLLLGIVVAALLWRNSRAKSISVGE